MVRTDFSNDDVWLEVVAKVLAETKEGFRAYVEIIDDKGFDGYGADEVLASITDDYVYTFVILVDHLTMVESDQSVLVIDRLDEPGRSFRALPETIQAIDNNLSIANMCFHEFANAVDSTGVFRGFG